MCLNAPYLPWTFPNVLYDYTGLVLHVWKIRIFHNSEMN